MVPHRPPPIEAPTLVVETQSLTPTLDWKALADELGFALGAERGAEGDSLRTVGVLIAGDDVRAMTAALARRQHSLTEWIVVGEAGSRRRAVAARLAGAQDYFVLPDDVDLLRAWLREWLRQLPAIELERAIVVALERQSDLPARPAPHRESRLRYTPPRLLRLVRPGDGADDRVIAESP